MDRYLIVLFLDVVLSHVRHENANVILMNKVQNNFAAKSADIRHSCSVGWCQLNSIFIESIPTNTSFANFFYDSYMIHSLFMQHYSSDYMIYSCSMQPCSFVIVASDGLWDFLSDEEAVAIVGDCIKNDYKVTFH